MFVKEKQRKTLIKVLFGDITMTMNTLSENDKNIWRNIKKFIEKQYKGKSGIYKININDNEYLAGIANRIDKKVISLINELLFEKNTDERNGRNDSFKANRQRSCSRSVKRRADS